MAEYEEYFSEDDDDNSCSSLTQSESKVVETSLNRDDEVYNMMHKKRGLALIFNHEKYKDNKHPVRNGVDDDRKNLKKLFKELDFEVQVFKDETCHNIMEILKRVSKDDHSESDCLLVFALSHGKLGEISAYDEMYETKKLWSYFDETKCPTLAGKPKMFFIQACQGDKKDEGIEIKNETEIDGFVNEFNMPECADFLIAHSTLPGFASFRRSNGSWFVQAICNIFNSAAKNKDVLSIMTRVNRNMNHEFRSYATEKKELHEKKQIPLITSTLTRKIFFRKKNKLFS